MLMYLINMLIILIPMLISVAFITLLERKFIGLSQFRKGPQKVGLSGVLQPFSDAIKLLSKESPIMILSNKKIFFFTPMINLILVLSLWMVMFSNFSQGPKWLILIFLFILGLGIYSLFFMGWSSNNKYSILGSVRGIAQSISYEISLALMLFIKAMSLWSMHMSLMNSFSSSLTLIFFPLSIMWLTVSVAETNRSPFDFSEGESELVSGFNTEFSGGYFTLIFLSEYSMILLLSGLSVYLILSLSIFSLLSVSFMYGFTIIWLWARTTLPRFRYDKLMDLAWKIILPLVLLSMNIFMVFYFYK